MAWSGWGSVYSRQEKSPLDRFRNKNKLLKAFSAEGPRLYEGLDGARTAEEIQAALGMPRERFAKIMDFMVSYEMVTEADEGVSPRPHPSVSGAEPFPPTNRPSASRTPPPAPPVELSIPPLSNPEAALAGSSRRSYPDGGAPSSASAPSARRSYSDAAAPPPPADADSSSGPPPPFAPAENLSPLERIIFERYGDVGVKVYNLIDGERTAEDILNDTGLSETKLVEILEFMNEQGIIKLERPAARSQSPPGHGASRGPPSSPISSAPGGYRYPPPPASASHSGNEGAGFKPMVEAGGEAIPGGSPDDVLSPDAVPVDVPLLPPRLSILQKAQMAGTLSMRFGKVGHDLLSHIDNNKDFVQLSIETGLALQDLDIILGELGKGGLMSFKPLSRSEISHRYGDDGLAVYKRFGREGLLIYELIGKSASLRDIIAKSRVDSERAVDIVIFVHRVLGLDLPIDRDTIFRYLERKQP